MTVAASVRVLPGLAARRTDALREPERCVPWARDAESCQPEPAADQPKLGPASPARAWRAAVRSLAAAARYSFGRRCRLRQATPPLQASSSKLQHSSRAPTAPPQNPSSVRSSRGGLLAARLLVSLTRASSTRLLQTTALDAALFGTLVHATLTHTHARAEASQRCPPRGLHALPARAVCISR